MSRKFRFETLAEALECYGEESLVPIDFLPQILEYSRCGCQPVHICESDKPGKKGKIVCYYLKSETQYLYRKWLANRPANN